jgi:hypothetical protein
MTRITILPEEDASEETTYRAVAGRKESVGRTAGEALDALTSQLVYEESGTLVISLLLNNSDDPVRRISFGRNPA